MSIRIDLQFFMNHYTYLLSCWYEKSNELYVKIINCVDPTMTTTPHRTHTLLSLPLSSNYYHPYSLLNSTSTNWTLPIFSTTRQNSYLCPPPPIYLQTNHPLLSLHISSSNHQPPFIFHHSPFIFHHNISATFTLHFVHIKSFAHPLDST